MQLVSNFSKWAYKGLPEGCGGKICWLLFLWPASLLYRLGLLVNKLVSSFRRPKRLPVPVISIGSITVGGAGKSPITAFIAKYLLNKGYKVAILSRGYNRASKELVIVADGQKILEDNPAISGDEPLMLANQLAGKAIIVSYSDRYQAGLKAIELGAMIILLDDGAQHQKLYRDLDIIVLQPQMPFGNCHLLPAGPLRDLPERIKQAGLIWYHGSQTISPKTQIARNRKVPINKPWLQSSAHLARLDISGKTIAAFCGLARPENFFNSLKSLNPQKIVPIIFNDHHNYDSDDFKKIALTAQENGCQLAITTEKDFVKISPREWPASLPLLTAELELELIENKNLLEDLLNGVLHG